MGTHGRLTSGPRSTRRLIVMPSDELAIAEIVRSTAEENLGRQFSPPSLNDDGTQPMQVDVLFKDAHPPIALEVTSIASSPHLATAATAQKLVDNDLDEFSRENDLGFWSFEVNAGTHLKSIADDLKAFMRANARPNQQPIRYEGDEHALLSGVIATWHRSDVEPGVRIGTWSGGALLNAGPELQACVDSNAQKLGRAEGYERHLAVTLDSMRATDHDRTPVPSLPVEVDFLWVVRRWTSLKTEGPVVWWTDGNSPWGTTHERWG